VRGRRCQIAKVRKRRTKKRDGRILTTIVAVGDGDEDEDSRRKIGRGKCLDEKIVGSKVTKP
jgi:hypothetical protein